MDQESKLRALALVRAGVTEDQEALQFLMQPPLPAELLLSAITVAAATLERAYGREGALEHIDGWCRLTLAEMA